MKMHFQIFQTERNKEKCNPVIPQPYGFSPVSIDVIQFSDELQIQNLLKSYYKFWNLIICPFGCSIIYVFHYRSQLFTTSNTYFILYY